MLEELKRYLNISWEDALLDEKLQGLLDSGQEFLDRLIGEPLDYTNKELRGLLFDYVRYAYNNCLEDFEKNFHMHITRIQLMKGAGHEIT